MPSVAWDDGLQQGKRPGIPSCVIQSVANYVGNVRQRHLREGA